MARGETVFIVEISSSAAKIAKKLPKDVRKEIIKHTSIIAKNPFACEKLKGRYSFLYSYHFAYRAVQYRIIYEVSKEKQRVYIRVAATRENIYKRLEEMGIKPLLH